MAEDSEKRFNAVMDKLFHAPPKPKPKSSPNSSTSSQLSRGTKRPSLSSALTSGQLKLRRQPVIEDSHNTPGVTVQAPLCRPWDREDLYKRLATFKSMTWFAKPDLPRPSPTVLQSCNYSAKWPSNGTLVLALFLRGSPCFKFGDGLRYIGSQVVSALNCARMGWVNVDADIIACESCGARLLFSTPSSWARHQVEKAALVFSLKLNNGHKVHCPWVDNACDETLTQFPPTSAVDLVDNYKKRFARLTQFVALPVISSAAIDSIRNPQLEHFLDGFSTTELGNKSTDASVTEHFGDECEAIFSFLYYQAQKLISLSGWEPRVLPYIVDCKDRQDESTRNRNLSAPLPAVPNGKAPDISVYSSGAADYTDENKDENTSDMHCDPSSVVLDCRLCGASVGLWAFCTVPRPVQFIRLVGCSEINSDRSPDHQDELSGSQSSQTEISSNENLVESREHTSTAPTGPTSSNGITSNLHLTIAGGPPPAMQKFRPTISLPVVGHNLRAHFSSLSQVKDQQSFKALIGGDTELMLLEGEDLSDSYMENLVENINCMPHSSITTGNSSENRSSADAVDPTAGDLCTFQAASTRVTSPSGQIVTGNAETPLNDASVMDVPFSGCQQQNPGADTIPDKQGKDPRQLSSAKAMEFDPIRQHRHFCPWIASNGDSLPGWKQVLNALERQKEFSSPLSAERPSSSLIKVDDPVGSVKRLFTPPSSKRKKFTHGSS